MNKLRKQQWLILALIVGILVIVVYLIVNRRPTSPPVAVSDEFAQNADNTQTTFGEITYSGSPPTPPLFLPVARVESHPEQEAVIRQKIIDAYQLQPVEHVDEIWNNLTNGVSFSKDLARGCYTLSLPGFDENLIPDWSSSRIQTAAQTFLTQILGENSLTTQTENITYWYGGEEIEQTIARDANVAAVAFYYTIAGLPIYYQKIAQPPFTVYLDGSETPFKFDYCPQFVTLMPGEEVATLTVDTVLNNINANLGKTSIITAAQPDAHIFDIGYFPSGVLRDAKLEYRIDEAVGLAYPFYRFSGTLNDRGGVPVTVELISPAIAVE